MTVDVAEKQVEEEEVMSTPLEQLHIILFFEDFLPKFAKDFYEELDKMPNTLENLELKLKCLKWWIGELKDIQKWIWKDARKQHAKKAWAR